MASQWIRWNNSTHIFEFSTDNGSSFAPLPLNAAIITEGTLPIGRLPTNVALKDANNIFTSGMPIEIDAATPVVFRTKETGQPVDQKQWQLYGTTGSLILGPLSDANALQAVAFQFFRSGVLGVQSGVDVGSGLQSVAKFRVRAGGSNFEWGNANQSGYGCTLGNENATGFPFIGFYCESGTNNNTYRTRGQLGTVIRVDTSGLFTIGKLTSNADNQSPTQTFSLDSSGTASFAGTIYAGYAVQAAAGYLERSRSVFQGDPNDIAYAAGNFFASSGTWTISTQTTNSYSVVGKTVKWQLHVNGNVSTAGAILKIIIPPGYTCAKTTHIPCSVYNGGVWGLGLVVFSAGSYVADVYATIGLAGWAVGANYLVLNATIITT